MNRKINIHVMLNGSYYLNSWSENENTQWNWTRLLLLYVLSNWNQPFPYRRPYGRKFEYIIKCLINYRISMINYRIRSFVFKSILIYLWIVSIWNIYVEFFSLQFRDRLTNLNDRLLRFSIFFGFCFRLRLLRSNFDV